MSTKTIKRIKSMISELGKVENKTVIIKALILILNNQLSVRSRRINGK